MTKRSSGRITIQDIAARANVSAMTVSRALKTPHMVSKKLRERISSISTKSGYVMHHGARTLASSKSKLIGVLVPSFSNELFVDVLAGIRDSLHPRGYQMMVGDTRYSPQIEEKLFLSYLEHVPDGFLLTGFDRTRASESLSKATAIPTVHMMDLSTRHMSVGFCQKTAGYSMGRYLIGRGYKRLAYIAAQLDPRVMKRLEGFRKAGAEAGIEKITEVMVPDPSSIGLGSRLLTQLLNQAPKCDAVFACNDDLAAGALFECQRRGLRVPEDLAVAGFNDLDLCSWTKPSITSVTTPRYQVGFQAAQLLLNVINKTKPVRTKIDLGFRLTEREST